VKARRESQTARLAQAQAEERRTEAERRRATAEAVTGMLERMLKSANPHEVRGVGYTVRQLLDDFTRDMGDGLAGQPETEATVRAAIGNAYRLLGQYERAGPHLDRALALWRSVHGDTHALTVRALCDCAWLLHDRADYKGAAALFEEAVGAERAAGESPGLAAALMGLSDARRHMGAAAADGEPAARESLALRERLLGPDHPDTGESLVNLAKLLRDRGQADAAEPLLVRALALWRAAYSGEHPRLVDAMNDHAWLLFLKRDLDGSERVARAALEMGERLLGPSHPDVANALYEIGMAAEQRGDGAAAEPPLRRALAIYRAAHGDEHPSVATALDSLARALQSQRRHDEAEPAAREALEIRRRLGAPGVEVGISLATLAPILRSRGDFEGAERSWREAIAHYDKAQGRPNRNSAVACFNLARMLDERSDRVLRRGRGTQPGVSWPGPRRHPLDRGQPGAPVPPTGRPGQGRAGAGAVCRGGAGSSVTHAPGDVPALARAGPVRAGALRAGRGRARRGPGNLRVPARRRPRRGGPARATGPVRGVGEARSGRGDSRHAAGRPLKRRRATFA
jgi:tetratricopeptide (TPR) repeat protein